MSNHHPIQRILVPLDISEYSEAATERACETAKAHFAQVSGLVVLDTPGIAGSIPAGELTFAPVIHEAIANLTEDARKRILEVEEKFAATCENAHITHQETQLEGIPCEKILEVSMLFDLVVMGLRTYFHFETRDGPGDSLAKVLGRTATPILAVPPEQTGPFRNVLIGWDGSFGAARALRDFVGFARPFEFERITVLTADEDEGRAKLLLEEAAAYLRSHDIESFETVHVPTSVMQKVQDEHTAEADLVVAGIHSKKLIKDIFVGSFTKAMIEKGDTAMFLSH